MAKNCEVCGEKIEEDEFGKLKGTIVKVKKEGRNEFRYLCSDCQRKEKV